MLVTLFSEARRDARELGLALERGLIVGSFAFDPKNVSFRDRDVTQERLVGHAVVAVCMVWWDAAFVSEGNLNAIPGQGVGLLSEGCVNGAWGIASS